ncbi:hypothetical protein [Mycobacterium sp. SM1]|nr:hypothetical protein [Mycobacterium sp. SM1]
MLRSSVDPLSPGTAMPPGAHRRRRRQEMAALVRPGVGVLARR